MDIIENNKLIAKFMGLKVLKGFSNHSNKYYYYYNNTINKDYEAIPNYSTDWNELILVLRKIDNLEYELPKDSNLIGDITTSLLNLDIEQVYLSILEFIKWHNENK